MPRIPALKRAQQKYAQTPKGKAAHKAAQRRYMQTARGRKLHVLMQQGYRQRKKKATKGNYS